jgi:hypothetical protein
MNEFQFDDGGRKDASYMDETGDWVACTIAIVRIAPVETLVQTHETTTRR